MRKRIRFVVILALASCWAGGCKSSSETQPTTVVQDRATTQERSTSHVAATQPSTSAPSNSGVVWKSIREHAGAGRLAIVLNPPGEHRIVSESRKGGITELEIDFDAPIKLIKPDAFRAESQGTAIAPTAVQLASPKQLLVQFAGLKEGCYRFSLAGVVEGAGRDAECRVRVLEGDINNDGHISLTDTLYIKSKIGQPVTEENAALDIDVSGKIDNNDVQQAKAAIRKAVACE